MSGYSDAMHIAGAVAACPGCGQGDQVAAVPAVYLQGRDSVQERVRTHGESGSHVRTRQVTTALAQALAPAPPKDPPGSQVLLGLGVLLAFGSSIAALIVADAPSPSEGVIPVGPNAGTSIFPDLSWLGWVAGFGYLAAVALIGTFIARRAEIRRRVVGRPQAEALWARGWYCSRCGTVHFRPDPDVPNGPLSLGGFRQLVWGAGGYADLTAKFPVL